LTVTSLLPPLSGHLLPPADAAGLLPAERSQVGGLQNKMSMASWHMTLSQQYYDGTQPLANLGISIPPGLAGIRTVVDWPRICVDPLVQRAVVDGFRMPGQTETDDELWGFWQANNLDGEHPLCVLDSLTLGRGYMIAGSADKPGDPPVITVESPFNLAANWDPRTRSVTAAYQAYEVEGVFRAVLYLPDVTVFMSRDQGAAWTVDHRDEHRLGVVPVVRFSNRSRTADREGRSEITAAVRNTTDSAVRTLLGMEIAREFYSVPQKYGLGIAESFFQNADGTAKSAWDASINKFLGLERDESGNVPTVGQFQAMDPSVFTKIIDSYAQLMSSYTQFPPDYFGLHAHANPASADAIRSAQDGLNRRARQVQNERSDPLEQVMCLAWRIAHNGAELPDAMRRLETDWARVETPTPAQMSDAIFTQGSMGAGPAWSDVFLSELGYSSNERKRLAQDRDKDAAAAELSELAQSLEAKEARTDKSVIEDLTPPAPETPAP
jgi:hypothetical protein